MERVYSGLINECCHLESLDTIVAELASFQPFPGKMRGNQKVSLKLQQKQFAFNCAYAEFHRHKQSSLNLATVESTSKTWLRGWEKSFWKASGLEPVEQYKTEWLASQPRFLKHLVLNQYYKLVASKYKEDETVRDSNKLTEEELMVLCQHYDPEYASSGAESAEDDDDDVAGDSDLENQQEGSISCEVYMDESKPNAVAKIVVNKVNGKKGPTEVTVTSTQTTTTERRTECEEGCRGCIADQIPLAEMCQHCWFEMREMEHREFLNEASLVARKDKYSFGHPIVEDVD